MRVREPVLVLFLTALILAGLGGLIAPWDPETPWGRMGAGLRRAAALFILAALIVGVLYRQELLAELAAL